MDVQMCLKENNFFKTCTEGRVRYASMTPPFHFFNCCASKNKVTQILFFLLEMR